MSSDRTRASEPHANVALFRYTVACAAAVLFLLLAGAAVKSTESGLAFPDWPLSNGTLMPDMSVPANFYEHGHRMVATFVGLMTVVLAVWIQRRDPRPAVRRLGWFALALVVVQGVFGGVTVLLELPVWSSATHGTLAQTFFLVIVFLALSLTRGWNTSPPLERARSLRVWTTTATAAVFVQLILGAVMRHLEAGLVIPTVPPAFLFPPPPAFTPEVAAHYAHRVGAVAVVLCVFAAATAAFRASRGRRDFTGPAALMLALVVVQFALGVLVVLTHRHLHTTNTHVVTGALLLAASFVLTARAWKFASPRPTTDASPAPHTEPRVKEVPA